MSVDARRPGGRFFGGLFPLLGGDEVRCCILHGWQSMPDSAPAEIDIAIAPGDVGRMEEALRNRTDTQVVQLLEYEASCYCFILAVRERTGVRFMALDTAMEYRQEGCVFFAGHDLVGPRRRANGLWVAAPEDEFRYLLVKRILKQAFGAHQKARLQALCASLGEEAGAIAARLLGSSAGSQVITWLTRGEWGTLEAQLVRLRRVLLWETIKRDPGTPIHYWLPELGRRWRRWAHPTGMCIVVAGTDRAMRQSMITRLTRDLGGAFRHVAVVPFRRPADELLRDPDGTSERLHRFAGAVKNVYALVAAAADYLVKVRPCLVRSGLVLVDCPLAGVPLHLLQSEGGIAALTHRLAHLPDLYLLLTGSERQDRSTLPERPDDALPRQDRWRSIVAHLPNAVLVDSAGTTENAAEIARDVVLDYLRRRYLHRRKLWFPDKGAESLRWLNSVICASPAASHFVSPREPRNGTRPLGARTSVFSRISLRDGRGYLIPLESRPAAVKSLDLYNAKPLKARIAKKLLALAFRLGVGGYCLPQVNLVKNGGCTESESADATLIEYLKDVLGRDDLVAAISLGMPSYHRKPVLLALSADGTPLAYVKVGSTDITNALVQHETETLRYLATGSFRSFASPRVLHADWWNGRFVCVQSVLTEGETQPVAERLTRRHVEIAQEFATTNLHRSPLRESSFWTHLLQQTGQVTSAAYRNPLSHGLHRVERRLDGVELPFHFGHGDFAPWNMKASKDSMVVFDWERASKQALPGWDLFHFVFEIMRVQGRGPEEICRAFLDGKVFRSGGHEYFRALRIGTDTQVSLLQLYLLARLARWAVDTPGHTPRFHDLQTLVRLLKMLECECGKE